MNAIAPVLFGDELKHAGNNLDLVWITIEDRYDRAYIDARISEILMSGIMPSATTAGDMTDAMRALLYAFHEDRVRRQCDLPGLLNDRAAGDLATMITALADDSGMQH